MMPPAWLQGPSFTPPTRRGQFGHSLQGLVARSSFQNLPLVVPPKHFVTLNDFMNHKGQELLGNVWVKVADRRKVPQAAHLLGFSGGIARRQPVLHLQFADSLGTSKPLRQHVDNRGIDIIDAVSQVSKFGSIID